MEEIINALLIAMCSGMAVNIICLIATKGISKRIEGEEIEHSGMDSDSDDASSNRSM